MDLGIRALIPKRQRPAYRFAIAGRTTRPYAAGIGAPQTKIHAMQHPSNRPFPLTFVRLHSNTILTQFLQPLLEWC